MNDVAFMVMDLVAHVRQDLTFSFLNAHLEHTGDYGGVRLQNSSKRGQTVS
jgi:aminoglycoside phosphotransferase family enzyme